jgi:hypothetical protein
MTLSLLTAENGNGSNSQNVTYIYYYIVHYSIYTIQILSTVTKSQFEEFLYPYSPLN